MTTNRRILLHIGSPKCGSTYLQQVMLKNQKRLLKMGINYPHDGTGHPGNGSSIGKLTEQSLGAMFPRGCHTLVLSHEDLLPQPPRGKPLAEIARKQGIEVQIVSFLRPFNEFIYGDYSQFMKQNFAARLRDRLPYGGQSFEEFSVSRSKVIVLVAWLNNWNKNFPQTSLRIEPHRNIKPVLQELLGLPDDMVWDIHANQVNRSLRVSDCEALAAALMDQITPEKELRAMFQAAHHKVEEPDAGRTPERDRWIEALFLDRNRNIHTSFGLDNRLDKSLPYR